MLIIITGSRKKRRILPPLFLSRIKELHSISSFGENAGNVIYVLPLLQVRIQNRCECWFESIQTSFYPTIWAFYWVSFSIQFVNSLKSLQPAWRASAFSEQILFWRISYHIILINIFKYSIGQVHSYRVWYPKKFKCM